MDQEGMRRKDEEGLVWWAWRRGDWMAAESGGRVDWRWRMRDLWVMRVWSVGVEMKISGGGGAAAGGLTFSCLLAAMIGERRNRGGADMGLVK